MSDPRSPAQLSAKMMEAQVQFQRVVKHELQLLVASGLEREVAVKMLLHRIVQSTYEPEEADVKRVMKQFQMMHDDAVRALIVKQEIGRLKGQGLDAFAAIELLTRKMQRLDVPEIHEIEQESSSAAEVTQEEMSDHSSEDSNQNGDNDKEETDNSEMPETPHDEHPATEEVAGEPTPSSESTLSEETDGSAEKSPSNDSHENASAASLSLCERIDQVSISAASPDATIVPDASAGPKTPSGSRSSQSTPRSAFTLFSSHSRKRRFASGDSSPVNEYKDDTPSSPLPSGDSSSNQRSHFFMARPLSPTFRFPKTKKQKVWTDDEIDEPVFDAISMKDSSIPPPASPTGVGTASTTSVSSTTATPTKIGKRRRALDGRSSPELDELDVEEPMVRVSKRHKL